MKNPYNRILEIVSHKEGFDYSAYHFPMLKRRIDNRIVRTQTFSPENYLDYLKTEKNEPKELVNYFMIHVSYFFRDAMGFELLKNKILPKIVSEAVKLRKKSIRIWSAGCAKGEEPYSVAILLKEYFEKEKIDLGIDLFATDFDENVIALAKQGKYSLNSLEESKIKYVNKYFTRHNHEYAVSSDIKSMVQFSQHNLLDKNNYVPSDSIFGNFDLVLCRNVLIYFSESYQKRVFEKFYKALGSNGILFLGEAEAPLSEFKDRFHQITKYSKIYEKINYES